MRGLKLFTSTDPSLLEKQVNQWLNEKGKLITIFSHSASCAISGGKDAPPCEVYMVEIWYEQT